MDSINLDGLFISVFVLGWLLCAGLVWLILAAQRRGRAAFSTLPASLILGCLAALLVPALGFRDGRALALSFPVAALGALLGTFAVLGAGAMMVRRAPPPRPSSSMLPQNRADTLSDTDHSPTQAGDKE